MKSYILFIIIVFSISACTDSALQEYNQLKKKELASGRRVDSLFFGIYFGMTTRQFYAHCWELNKKGIFTDGESNTAVMYRLNNHELKYDATMNFYPEFQQNKINKMKVSFRYNAWAPWNKLLISDSLQSAVLHLYEQWYQAGNPFIKIHDKERGILYIKVDGNRRIIIGKYDDMHVKVDYTDLSTEVQTNK